MLIIMEIYGVSCFRLWAKTLESIKFRFFNWHTRQRASFMTHFGLQPSPPISEIKQGKIIFMISLTYWKTASGFPPQPSIQVSPFSGSIFLPSLLLLNINQLNRSQQSSVHPYLWTLTYTFPSPGMPSHSKTLPAIKVHLKAWLNLPWLVPLCLFLWHIFSQFPFTCLYISSIQRYCKFLEYRGSWSSNLTSPSPLDYISF